jgi:transcriptional adapter 2-alpha
MGDGKLKVMGKSGKKKGSVKKSISTLIELKLEDYDEQINQRRAEVTKTNDTFNDVLGYMPLREDFDVEYDNDAELFLAEMEFNGIFWN